MRHNSRYTIHSSKCNSVVSVAVTELCNPHHYLIPEHFHDPKKKLHEKQQKLPFALNTTQTLTATNLFSICVDLPVLGISHKRNHTTHGLVCRHLPLTTMCSGSIHIGVHVRAPSFHGCVIVHLWLQHIFFLSFNPLIDLWAVMNNAIMDFHVQLLLWTDVISPVDILSILGGELLGHIVTLCFTFWIPARLSSTEAASFYIPASNAGGF